MPLYCKSSEWKIKQKARRQNVAGGFSRLYDKEVVPPLIT